MLKKIGRILILIVAVLVILLSLGGILGAWWFSSTVSDVTLKISSVIQTGVQVVDSAVGRVDTFIQTARSEVQQAGDMVTTVASNLQENRPILTALSERLDNRLGPAVDQIQQTLAPVHDVLVNISSAVSFANSIPFIQERAPRLDELDQTLTRLSTLGADVQQLRTTLRAMVTEQASRLTQEASTALTNLVSRVDSRLADIQSGVQSLQSEITALQARIQTVQSRLLLIYNLIALAATLLFVWVIYSQIVVIRHHWSRHPSLAPSSVPPEQSTPAVAMQANTQAAVKIDEEDKAQQAAEADVETPPSTTAPDKPAEGSDSQANAPTAN